jgi:hypothetical protein
MSEIAAYRCHIKVIKRSEGKSVVNSAAYISRSKIYDERLGKTFNYEKGYSEVLYSQLHTPDIGINWVTDRCVLWNTVEATENRKDSQLARMLELNLPNQLSTQQMIATLENFVKDNFICEGMIADINLHAPDNSGDARNTHAHILLTMRKSTEHGFDKKKSREWNATEISLRWREAWALECSKTLNLAGFELTASRWQYGHLTLKEQRNKAIARGDLTYADICNHEAGKHKGTAIAALEKRGTQSFVQKDREAKLKAIKFIHQQNLDTIEKELQLIYESERKILQALERMKLPSIKDILETAKRNEVKHGITLQLRR